MADELSTETKIDNTDLQPEPQVIDAGGNVSDASEHEPWLDSVAGKQASTSAAFSVGHELGFSDAEIEDILNA